MTQKLSLGNLRYAQDVKHMLGNNPFKGQHPLLIDAIALAKKTKVFADLNKYFTYLPEMHDSYHGSMFFKYKFDNTSLYVVYATGQLRKYNLNKEGKIRSYQGNRLTTINCISAIQDAINLFNADNPYHAAKTVSAVYEMAMTHLLEKVRTGKLQSVASTDVNNGASAVNNGKSFNWLKQALNLKKLEDISTVFDLINEVKLAHPSHVYIFCKDERCDILSRCEVFDELEVKDCNTYLTKEIVARVDHCIIAPFVSQGTIMLKSNESELYQIILNFRSNKIVRDYNKAIENKPDNKGWIDAFGNSNLTVSEARCTNGFEALTISPSADLSDLFDFYIQDTYM